MKLIDHTDGVWDNKLKKSRIWRANGAFTYSRDLVKYQIPHWKEVLGKNDLISTCPKISEVEVRGVYDTIIQYLHSYPYYNSLHRVQTIVNCGRYKAKRIIFVVAYKEFVSEINRSGMRAVFAPMGIDVQEIQQYEQPKIYDDRIIYFGNIIQNKTLLFNKMKRACLDAGLKFDYISMGKFNSKDELTREEMLKLVSQYKYGIGVGRAAQEMMALGLKIIVAGHKFGGLITTEEEYKRQLDTNINGRIITYTPNISIAIRDIDKAIIKAHDVREQNHAKLI